MSPSMAPAPRPLIPGSAAHQVARMQHEQLVARLARARLLLARLPAEIALAERQLRELEDELGIPRVEDPWRALDAGREAVAPLPRGERQELVLKALPGTVAEVARRAGADEGVCRNILSTLFTRGLVQRSDGKPTVWARTDEPPAADERQPLEVSEDQPAAAARPVSGVRGRVLAELPGRLSRIVERTGLTIKQVANALDAARLAGLVERGPEGWRRTREAA